MKNFAIVILAFLYLSTSAGATIHLHYCMGKLVNWGLWHSDSKKCSKCGMNKSHKTQKNGCCKDEHKQIKNDKDQKAAETTVYLIHAASVAVLIYQYEISSVNISSITENNPLSNAPPRSPVAIYIRNCIFLI
jgi:hypothetical protein